MKTNSYINKTIMIVDDNSYVREVLRQILRREGYSIVEAEHGGDALEKLKTFKVDVVITDLRMPVMNGIDFIKRLRITEEHSGVPIIMLTSENREYIKIEGTIAGANEWILKPVLPSELLSAVRKFI